MLRSFTNVVVALASVAITTGTVAFADPAFASAPAAVTDASRVVVNLADLDLRSDAGRSIAKHRIGHAIDEVCGINNLQDRYNVECRKSATVAARDDLARVQTL